MKAQHTTVANPFANAPGGQELPTILNPEGFTHRQNLMAGFFMWEYLKFFLFLIYWISGFFTMSVVVFLRRDFGERYLSWLNLYAAWTTVIMGIVWSAFLSSFSGNRGVATGAWPIMLFVLAFIGTSLYHRYRIAKRRQAQIPWHSFGNGIPHLQALFARWNLVPTREAINKWFEPLLLLLLSWPVGWFSGPLGTWLFICAIAVAVREQVEYFYAYQAILDQVDATIEALYMKEAVLGSPPERAAGFTIPRGGARLLKSVAEVPGGTSLMRPDVAQVFGQLTEAELHLIDSDGAKNPLAGTPTQRKRDAKATPPQGGLSDQERALLDDE